MENDSKWLTVKEAALYLKVSQMTLFRWMKSGKLKHYKMGNAVRLLSEDLDAIAEPRGEKKTSSAASDQKPSTPQNTTESPSKEDQQSCLMCGSQDLIDGRLQSTGVVQFRPDKTKFWAWTESNVPMKTKMCTTCGFLHQFADTDKMERLFPNE